MTTKEIMLIIFGLIWLMLVAVVIMFLMRPAPSAQKVKVLVAATNIALHQPLTEKNVAWQEISIKEVQPEDIRYSGTLDYIGKAVLIPLQAKQVIKRNYLETKKIDRLAQVIRPGKYAMTVELTKNNDDNMFIKPGDNVDVFLTRSVGTGDSGRSKNEFLTQRLLSTVRVLAVDNMMFQGPIITAAQKTTMGQKTLTLEVTPKQAERLALGGAMGSLSFSLHNELSDKGHPVVAPLSSKSLEWGKPIVEYHGSKVVQQQF